MPLENSNFYSPEAKHTERVKKKRTVQETPAMAVLSVSDCEIQCQAFRCLACDFRTPQKIKFSFLDNFALDSSERQREVGQTLAPGRHKLSLQCHRTKCFPSDCADRTLSTKSSRLSCFGLHFSHMLEMSPCKISTLLSILQKVRKCWTYTGKTIAYSL